MLFSDKRVSQRSTPQFAQEKNQNPRVDESNINGYINGKSEHRQSSSATAIPTRIICKPIMKSNISRFFFPTQLVVTNFRCFPKVVFFVYSYGAINLLLPAVRLSARNLRVHEFPLPIIICFCPVQSAFRNRIPTTHKIDKKKKNVYAQVFFLIYSYATVFYVQKKKSKHF